MRSSWPTSLRHVLHDVKARGSGMMLHMRFRYCNIKMRRFKRPLALGLGSFKPPPKHRFFLHLLGRLVGSGWWSSGGREGNDYDTLAVALE